MSERAKMNEAEIVPEINVFHPDEPIEIAALTISLFSDSAIGGESINRESINRESINRESLL